MVNLCGIYEEEISPTHTRLTRKCPFCGQYHSITLGSKEWAVGLNAVLRLMKIQDAFPNLSDEKREFIMTGICPKCWPEPQEV